MNPLGPQFDLLTQLLSASELRQQVVSSNIANVNTPNFRQLEVTFEEQLANVLKRSPGREVANVAPTVQETAGLTSRQDGNNVNLDEQIGQMNKNALLQQTYLQLMGVELSMMQRAIRG